MANIKVEIAKQKQAFLAECPNDMKPILTAMLNKKERELENNKKETKEKAKEIAAMTKELMTTEYVHFDDGTSLTVAEMALAVATRNTLSNPKSTFKDVNDIQKVIDNDISQGSGGLVVVINNNGQDLGE